LLGSAIHSIAIVVVSIPHNALYDETPQEMGRARNIECCFVVSSRNGEKDYIDMVMM
jgi:hypothetical protein